MNWFDKLTGGVFKRCWLSNDEINEMSYKDWRTIDDFETGAQTVRDMAQRRIDVLMILNLILTALLILKCL